MEQDFTIAEFIELMRKTKKTDPLFKPLKKIKTALEVTPLLYRASA